MKVSKDKLVNLATSLADTMRKITNDFQMGFGSFIDKPMSPFVNEITKYNHDFRIHFQFLISILCYVKGRNRTCSSTTWNYRETPPTLQYINHSYSKTDFINQITLTFLWCRLMWKTPWRMITWIHQKEVIYIAVVWITWHKTRVLFPIGLEALMQTVVCTKQIGWRYLLAEYSNL